MQAHADLGLATSLSHRPVAPTMLPPRRTSPAANQASCHFPTSSASSTFSQGAPILYKHQIPPCSLEAQPSPLYSSQTQHCMNHMTMPHLGHCSQDQRANSSMEASSERLPTGHAHWTPATS